MPNQSLSKTRKGYALTMKALMLLSVGLTLEIAKSDDYVAILGKGNEQNIVYKDELIPFNDYQVVIDNIMVR